MYCHKCGKEIPDGSEFCCHCGASVKTSVKASGKSLKPILIAGIATVAVIAAGLGLYKGYEHWQKCYAEKNPEINSPKDITDDLIQKIIANDIDSLTINYEFTRCQNNLNELRDGSKHEEKRTEINPFWKANNKSPIKRIEFEIKLAPNVRSLACAFAGLSELEYVNIKDTSNVTDMAGMFSEATSFI